MYVLIACLYHEDRIKNSRQNMETFFPPIISLFGFFPDAQGQLISQLVVGIAKFRTRPRLHACARYLRV